jgi:hypothetical protein
MMFVPGRPIQMEEFFNFLIRRAADMRTATPA